jgi:hypothetical protein
MPEGKFKLTPFEYLPAAQERVHLPTNDRMQTQLVSAVDPAVDCVFDGHATQVLATVAPVVVEYVPAPQSVHATEPDPVLYFPAAHAAHVPPSGPVNQRLQTQLVSAVDPTVDWVFVGQLVHASVPVLGLYVFTAQLQQLVLDPVPSQSIWPAGHEVATGGGGGGAT